MGMIGIDTGGTFTDLVYVDPGSGRYAYHKLLTTRDDASEGIVEGLRQLLELAGSGPAGVRCLVHGTTLATNAVLQRAYAKVGLITTRGFRDILELARQRRPAFYNLDVDKPEPPAARDCRLEVDERLGPDGSVVTPLDEAGVAAAALVLRGLGCDAVAICFLHAYANDAHERRARELIREVWPEAYLCLSSEVCPEYREFERFATTSINASLMPVVDRYLQALERKLRQAGVPVPPRVMQSNGGTVAIEAIRQRPINTFFSGPAGGVIGVAGLGAQAGLRNLIAFDMGGTSTDVCLVHEGVPAMKNQSAMAGFPVSARTMDMHTIGAGGGSIAWRDPGGLLKVGPASAGSTPGPAGYGRGGEEPTVTDANIFLGRLNPVALLGGRMAVRPDLAEQALQRLGGQLGLATEQVAAGIVSIVNVGMQGAVRLVSVERGHDPRRFVLAAYGGAAGLHAAEVARAMGIARVFVPFRPGVMSALGLLHADVRGDFSITCSAVAAPSAAPVFEAARERLQALAAEWLATEGHAAEEASFECTADMRYAGQNYELPVLCDPAASTPEQALALLREAFDARHEAAYGYALADRRVEIVTLRLAVVVALPPIAPDSPAWRKEPVDWDAVPVRQVWFAQTGFVPTPVLQREQLAPGFQRAGPLIVEQMDTTTVVPVGCAVAVDEHGNMLIDTGVDRQAEEV